MTVLDNIPMPKLHRSGAAHSDTQECAWWPNAEDSARALRLLDSKEPRNGFDAEAARIATAAERNDAWTTAARQFLLDYSGEDRSVTLSRRDYRDHGAISAAITRLRDDRVVLDSIPGVTDKTREGLDLQHRDVLAAVALLSQVDKTRGGRGVWFREGGLEPYKKPRGGAR